MFSFVDNSFSDVIAPAYVITITFGIYLNINVLLSTNLSFVLFQILKTYVTIKRNHPIHHHRNRSSHYITWMCPCVIDIMLIARLVLVILIKGSNIENTNLKYAYILS